MKLIVNDYELRDVVTLSLYLKVARAPDIFELNIPNFLDVSAFEFTYKPDMSFAA